MLSSRRVPLAAQVVVGLVTVVLAVGVGCTPGATSSDEDDADPATGQPPSVSVTIPPSRLTPFCQAMIDLNDRLENDPPDDVEAEIIATYEAISSEVPDVIREDFDAVLADLKGGESTPPASDAPTTTPAPPPPVTDDSGGSLPPGDPFFDEGYDPDDDPALRLNAYVNFECRSVENNPGPPATQPLTEPPTTEP